MLVEEFTVNNEVGLHARPAANFVQTASKFKSKITLIKDGKEVDAKSNYRNTFAWRRIRSKNC